MEPTRTLTATATGQLDAGFGSVHSLALLAGSTAATAVLRTGGASGVVLGVLGAPTGGSARHRFGGVVAYSNLHVTISGTSPRFLVEV